LDRTGQTLLGKYQLTGMLGKGGMGEVWEGEHLVTGRRVAVKVLADNYLSNRKVVARFGREARAASAVRHDGIVEILDQDNTDDGVPFLVMEFLEGQSVGERLRARGKLPQADALAVMLPLLDALDAAHEAGVIHRDLKPDNVFIVPGPRGEERIKILDFGISRKADEVEHRLTQEGSVLGTPHYMSPEQARGEPGIDARADLYAAAVLFYECVVGDVPFDAANYNALLQIILGTPPASPRSRGADLSSPVEQVLLATLDKDKRRRPPSARARHDLLIAAAAQPEDAALDRETPDCRLRTREAQAAHQHKGRPRGPWASLVRGPARCTVR
jgi:eukaryotic-like serine/threonine-protein kinase